YAMPLYPESQPVWVKSKGHAGGELVDPGLHAQPAFTDRGYVATANANKLGEMTLYIAWKAEAAPQAAPAAEPEKTEPTTDREARRRDESERRERDLEARKARDRERRLR